MLKIDGSVLEGGGQILRLALSLAALLKKPIEVASIRAGRKQPGLRPQHLTGLQLVAAICRAKVTGDHIGSTAVTFTPGAICGGHFTADTGTAGAVTLLLQVALPVLLFAPEQTVLTLRGGTNAEMAPQIDTTLAVLRPILRRLGVLFDVDVVRRGYYPRGGGEVVVTVQPLSFLPAFEIVDRGHLVAVRGRSFVAGTLPISIAQRTASAATKLLKRSLPTAATSVESVKEAEGAAIGAGSGLCLVAETNEGCFLGASAVGRRGLAAEAVAEAAAAELLEDWAGGAAVDRHLQDQLVVLMALADGASRVRCGPLTLHTRTAIHVAEAVAGVKFAAEEEEDGTWILECTGLGLVNPFLSNS